MLAWGGAPGFQPHRKRALKARLKRFRSPSIPHKAVVELNLVSAQQLAVSFLKSAGAMVLFPCLYVYCSTASSSWLGLTEKAPYPRCQKTGMNRAFSAGAF